MRSISYKKIFECLECRFRVRLDELGYQAVVRQWTWGDVKMTDAQRQRKHRAKLD